jgi:hypothetical protein
MMERRAPRPSSRGEDARRSIVSFFCWTASEFAYFFGLKSSDAEFMQ